MPAKKTTTKTPVKRAAGKTVEAQSAPSLAGRILSARRDMVDFRDKMYVPTLVEVPAIRSLESFLKHQPLILDQGQEGACRPLQMPLKRIAA